MINEDYVLETFKEGDINIEVKVDYANNTVWLSQKDMSDLFQINRTTITKNIKNSYDMSPTCAKNSPTCANFATVQIEGDKTVNRKIKHYNLDIILAVGYKCNSEITAIFKDWVDNLFEDYIQPKNEEKWLNEAKYYEIVKFVDGDFSLDVNVSPNEDTVWLTTSQISILFDRNETTIRKHINNIFDEKELTVNNNAHFLRVVGVKQKIAIYSLNVIISVGYRVKSQRGVQFRIWATSILKQYLLKGHVINEERCLTCTTNIIELQNNYKKVEEKLDTVMNYFNDPTKHKEIAILDGMRIEADVAYQDIFKLANSSIIYIDDYIDVKSLLLLKACKTTIDITIISDNSAKNKLNSKFINDFKKDTNIDINFKYNNDLFHDRYIIIDFNTSNYTLFHCGASSKDAGKNVTTITLLSDKDIYIAKINEALNHNELIIK